MITIQPTTTNYFIIFSSIFNSEVRSVGGRFGRYGGANNQTMNQGVTLIPMGYDMSQGGIKTAQPLNAAINGQGFFVMQAENSSQHLYTIEVLNNEKFINNMRNAGIVCGVHYPALHKNPIYNDGVEFNCPKSEKLEKRTVSLPMNETLSLLETEYIIDKVKENL